MSMLTQGLQLSAVPQYAAAAGTAGADIDAAHAANMYITHKITQAKLEKEGADGAKEVA